MQLWHLTFSSTTRHALFPKERLRRRALRKTINSAIKELVLYSLVDDHLHLVVMCNDARAGLLQRVIQLTIGPLAMGEIEAHRRLVEGRSHLTSLLRYHLLQVEKHAIQVHPALWSGSCFQELAGARVQVDLAARMRDVLPRVGLFFPHEIVGIPARPILPADDQALHAAGATRLVAAVGVSLLAGPALTNKSRATMLAKRCAWQLAAPGEIAASELAHVLGVDASNVRKWHEPRVDEPILRAARVRVALENLVTGALVAAA